ncbi:MAG: type IV pilin [Methanocorpusculum sp.]|nr:type IV pilin [Methanocorpusculum sp.]
MVTENYRNDHAVSPVVGVMLMLVVTIIIAAVVSMFASGMMAGTPAASTAQVKFLGIASGGSDMTKDDGLVGLIFEVRSGTLDLQKLKFYVSGTDYFGGGEAYMYYSDPIWDKYYLGGTNANKNQLRYQFNNPADAAKYGVRMIKFSNLTVDDSNIALGLNPDPMVTTGERFILFFEYLTPATATNPTTLGFGIHRNDGTSGGTAWQSGAVYANGDAHYVLSDTAGTVYASGYLKESDVL